MYSKIYMYNVFIYRSKTIEISKLQDALDGAKCGYKSYENRLMVADAQIVQLEKQLFELTSAKIHVNNLH